MQIVGEQYADLHRSVMSRISTSNMQIRSDPDLFYPIRIQIFLTEFDLTLHAQLKQFFCGKHVDNIIGQTFLYKT